MSLLCHEGLVERLGRVLDLLNLRNGLDIGPTFSTRISAYRYKFIPALGFVFAWYKAILGNEVVRWYVAAGLEPGKGGVLAGHSTGGPCSSWGELSHRTRFLWMNQSS